MNEMRRREFAGSAADGLALFTHAPEARLAGVTADGAPVLRTVNGVVEGGWLCFHAAPAGEKTSLLGRPVVAQVEEVVAQIPSTFMDPVKACPATTLYRSAQVHGVLTAIEEPDRKARVLQQLMEKLQPEGGYHPITAPDPLYRAPVRGLLVAGLPLDQVTTKLKLGQNRSPEQRVTLLEKLWGRGSLGDPRAVELIRAANPGTPVPPFLQAPEGLTLRAWLPDARASEAAALIADEYWNDVFTREQLERSHRGSAAWIGLEDVSGALVGTARAISDGGKAAWIYDVCVRRDLRRRGLGQVLMRLLLDHPRVRDCSRVRLGTRDAMSLYARFGFVPLDALPPRPYATTEMMLVRPSPGG